MCALSFAYSQRNVTFAFSLHFFALFLRLTFLAHIAPKHTHPLVPPRIQIDAQKAMSVLNVGQNLTITAGVVVAMWVAARAAVGGAINIGDFVLINQVLSRVFQRPSNMQQL